MKNFKKVGCMLVGCAMVVSMFAGCSTDKAAQQNTKKDATESGQETVAVQLANQDSGAVKKTSQEVAQERIAARSVNSDSKTSQEIAKERMAARKAAESKPAEPAEKETEQATESTAAESEPTEPVVSMQNNTSAGTSSKPAEQKPAESTQTQPKQTEPAHTEPAPTEPKATEPAPTEPAPTEPAPTEPEKEYIDIAALEEYGRQYAASLGFIPNASLTMDNSSYFPCMAWAIDSMDDGRKQVAGGVLTTYDWLMAADGTIEGAGCNVCIIDRGDATYFIYVLYG